jgi:hypothetical protein
MVMRWRSSNENANRRGADRRGFWAGLRNPCKSALAQIDRFSAVGPAKSGQTLSDLAGTGIAHAART